MSRVCLLPFALLLVLAVLGSRAAAAGALDAETIKAALRTATPEEDGFIELVVTKVEKGLLPRDLVESTFLWAKKKPRHKFQYFKRGLILRAAQQGISI